MSDSEPTPEEGGHEVAGPKPSKLPLLAMVVGGLNLLATGFVIMKVGKIKPTVAVAVGAAGGKGGHADDEKTPAKGELGPIKSLETFIVNLNEAGTTRFLKATLDVEMANAKKAASLEDQKVAIRDDVMRYLSNLSYNDTRGSEGKQKIQEEIVARINQRVGNPGAVSIFFKEFVVQ